MKKTDTQKTQKSDFERMKRLSADIRIETIKAIGKAGFGHIGGSASIADVLGVLYGGVMNVDPQNPKWEKRDRLVLSKGHCAPALYAALGLRGFFPRDWLDTLNAGGTRLPSHADMRLVPGVDMTTGSLGQGISAAVGIALANRIKGEESYTYCIVGDGELNEGQVWEACEAASHQKLERFIVFVDWNKKQLDGRLEDINIPGNIAEKIAAFGLDTQQVKGYDVEEIYTAVERAKQVKGKPHAIILDTIKGLGISFAERAEFNHYLVVDQAMVDEGVAEVEKRYAGGCYPGGDFKW